MIAGTRESALAMAQTMEFKRRFEEMFPDKVCEIRGITSAGDRDLTTHLKDMGGTGVFVRELDEALLAGRVDVTVNSLKDIPAAIDPRIAVAAVLPRADVRDACVPVPFDELSCGAFVGTSSVRREWMVRTARADLRLKPIRGNMNTRLSRLESGEYTAVLMAKAGLDRLGISDKVYPIPKEKFVPAAGQGAIAVECRAGDTETLELLKKLDDAKTHIEVKAERDILRHMNAGCSSPVGVNAEVIGDRMRIIAVSFLGPSPIRIDTAVPIADADTECRRIAETLLGGLEK